MQAQLCRKHWNSFALMYPSQAWVSAGRQKSKMAFESNWFKRKKKWDPPLPPQPKFLSITFRVLKVEVKTWVLCQGYAISDWVQLVILQWDVDVGYVVYWEQLVARSPGFWFLTHLLWSWASHLASLSLSEMTKVGQIVCIHSAWTYGYVFILRYSTPKHIRKS